MKSTLRQDSSYDFSEESGAGFENVKNGDLKIPFLMMLQSGSPEVKKSHKDYLTKGIAGAQEGHIINTVTREIMNPNILTDKIAFVPVFYRKGYVEWKDRDSGGGIVTTHEDERALVGTHKNEKGQDVLSNGNIIVTTAYFFGLVVQDEDDPIQVVLSLASTQLKKSRAWMSLATSIRLKAPDGSSYNPPLYSHKYLLSAQAESNAKGSWMGWKIENGGILQNTLLIGTARAKSKEMKESQLKLTAPAEETPNDELPGQ